MRLPALRLPAFGPAHMVLAVAALLLGLFLYSAMQTATQTYRLHDERRDLTQQVERLRTQKSELEGLQEYLASDEYIESVARSQFGLVKPGETAVVVDAPPAPTPTTTPGERWWESLFSR
jgi:cell division protein DivIC